MEMEMEMETERRGEAREHVVREPKEQGFSKGIPKPMRLLRRPLRSQG